MRNKQTHVRIRGPLDKGQRVLRPHTMPMRPKGTRFYNPNGEDFEDVCSLLWAQQLEAAGNIEIIGDATPALAAAPAVEETKPAHRPHRSDAPKGDK